MKRVFALLLFCLSVSCSSGKKISGYYTIRKTSDPYNGSRINMKKYSVFLLKDLSANSNFKKILDSKREKFKITIRKKDLIEYNYLMFVSNEGNVTYQMSKIPNDTIFTAKIEDNLAYFYSM